MHENLRNASNASSPAFGQQSASASTVPLPTGAPSCRRSTPARHTSCQSLHTLPQAAARQRESPYPAPPLGGRGCPSQRVFLAFSSRFYAGYARVARVMRKNVSLDRERQIVKANWRLKHRVPLLKEMCCRRRNRFRGTFQTYRCPTENAEDRFRNAQQPFGLADGNYPSCP